MSGEAPAGWMFGRHSPPPVVVKGATVAVVGVGVGVAAAGLNGMAGSGPAALLVLALLAGLLVLAVAVGWRHAALAIVTIAALLSRYEVTIAGLHLKPETAVVPLVAVLLIGELVLRRHFLSLSWVDWLLGGWVVTNAVGSLFAPARGTSLKLTLQLALLFAGYLAVRQLLRTAVDVRFALTVMLVGLTVVAAIGVIAYLVYPLGVNLGIQIDPITHRPTAYATLYEGNLYGSSVMVAWFWWLVALVTGTTRRWVALAGLAVTTVGVEVSLARGTWVAVAAALVIGAGVLVAVRRSSWTALRQRALDLGEGAGVALALSVLVWIAPMTAIADAVHAPVHPAAAASGQAPATGSASPAIVARVTTFSGPSGSATIAQRLQVMRTAVHDWRAHPLTGLGPGSFGESHVDSSHQPAWIGILPVRILHDTGVLGVVLFTAFAVLLAWRWVEALRGCDEAWLRAALIAQGLALVGLVVAYTATEGLELLFVWLILGFCAATIEMAGRTRSLSARSAPA